MKKFPVLLILLLPLSFLHAQKCKEIFNVSLATDKFIVVDTLHMIYAVGGKGYRTFDYTTGTELSHEKFVPEGAHSPGLDEKTGYVILSDYKKILYAYDLGNRKKVWELNGFANIQSLMITRDYLLVFEKVKPRYPVSCVDPASGKILWQIDNPDKAIEMDGVDYLGNDVFIVDHSSGPSKVIPRRITLLSALTGDSILGFSFKCKRLDASVSDKAFFFTGSDSAGTFIVKADIEKKNIAWTHRTSLPYHSVLKKPNPAAMFAREYATVYVDADEKYVFFKTNEGLEIISNATGQTVFYRHIPSAKTTPLDDWMGSSAVSLIRGDYAYMPYYVTRPDAVPKVNDYYLKKINYLDSAEQWTVDFGVNFFLRKFYMTGYGILVQFGGITSTQEGPEPYPNYTLAMIDDQTGKILWTVTDGTQSIFRTWMPDKDHLLLLGSKSYKSIDLSNGKDVFSIPHNVIRYRKEMVGYGMKVLANDLESFYMDFKRNILVYFPGDQQVLKSYLFEP